VELSDTGGLTLIDYKTGAAPAARDVRNGIAPQLPLSAAIAAAGGFDDGATFEIEDQQNQLAEARAARFKPRTRRTKA
jgi:ATP-dependent helicase/nuclease subunit B